MPVSALELAVADADRPEIASFPPVLDSNPYQRLLYGELTRYGFVMAEPADLDAGWLLRSRRRVGVLHFHWPQGYYRHPRGPRATRLALSTVKLPLFTFRLALAKALGYRIAWTVHQVRPHEPELALDAVGARILAKFADVLIVHDTASAAETARLRPRRRPVVIPHGSYVGVYPEGRARPVVRRELAIEPDAFVFLAFGEIRGYKDLATLLDAFRTSELANVVLLIVGRPRDPISTAALESAAAADPRIKLVLEFVPAERVSELFNASDAAVLPRPDGGTSGSAILALSLGVPLVAASTPTYVDLTGQGAAGWYFEGGNLQALAATLEAVSRDRRAAEAKGEAARALAEALAWPDIARRTAQVLAGNA